MRLRGPEKAKNLCGEKSPPPDSDPFSDASVAKIRLASQHNPAQRGSPDSALQAQCRPIVEMSTVKVTAALLLRINAGLERLSIVDMNTETTNSMLVRVSRFFSDRYAYRTQPGYLSELLAFGMIVFIAVWPIILVVHTMAVAPR